MGGYGGIFHLTHRCHNRSFLLKFARDRDAYRAKLREHLKQFDVALLDYCLTSNHVHLLVEVDPQFGVHRLVKAIKGRSSRVLREEFPWLRSKLPSLWTNSYFVATVGGAPLSVIKRYVEMQKAR